VGVSRPYNYDPAHPLPTPLPGANDTDYGFSKSVRFGDNQILKSVATDDFSQNPQNPKNPQPASPTKQLDPSTQIDQNSSYIDRCEPNYSKYDHNILSVQRVIGVECGFMPNLVWNVKEEYFCYTAGNRVIVNMFNPGKEQKILDSNFLDRPAIVKLSYRGRFLIVLSKESRLETGCFCEVYDGRT
jgi:hypothetical protein